VADEPGIDRDALDIFERSVRGVLGQPDVDVAAALEQVGWREFVAVDAASVVPLLFGVLGELVLDSRALDDVAFDALGPVGAARRDAGHVFVHSRRVGGAAAVRGSDLVVAGLVLGGRVDAPAAVTLDAQVVTVPANRLAWSPVGGIDPSLGAVLVRGTLPLPELEIDEAVDAAPSVAHACRRALAHELLGAVDAMLAMATEYAKVRTQFGQPIGAFQAVKHRLADVFVARQAAAAVVDESWRSDPECTTLAAKALAAHAGALASENCLQVFGAIGFTLEHDLHRFIRRVRVLDRLYGAEAELRAELGRVLKARGRVPRPGAA
jgi:Acyl-CoA dehydrogenase, C-terminal domain